MRCDGRPVRPGTGTTQVMSKASKPDKQNGTLFADSIRASSLKRLHRQAGQKTAPDQCQYVNLALAMREPSTEDIAVTLRHVSFGPQANQQRLSLRAAGSPHDRAASATLATVKTSAAIFESPSGSCSAIAETTTPITGTSIVPIAATEAGRR